MIAAPPSIGTARLNAAYDLRLQLANKMQSDGIPALLVAAHMLAAALRPGHPVLTLEDHALQNGFGTAVLEYAAAFFAEPLRRLFNGRGRGAGSDHPPAVVGV